MTLQNHASGIPEGYGDLLRSTALAHVATIGPDGEHFINAMAKKYTGMDRYPYHQSGDEHVVIFVSPGHTTQTGA